MATTFDRCDPITKTLFDAKKKAKVSFEDLGKQMGRDEVWVAALFYGQAKPESKDLQTLSKVLSIPLEQLDDAYGEHFYPDRAKLIENPPRDPLIYRLYEIVGVLGYPFKSVIAEKFGDGIMSAISFSTHVDREEDDKGTWVVIKLRGKWLPYTRY